MSHLGDTLSYVEVNPLSNPKGVKHECELCGKQAHFMCNGCRVTYYCTKEHQQIDWEGIHDKLCKHLIPLRTTPAFLGSEQQREVLAKECKKSQIALMKLTKMEGLKSLHGGHYELAIPASLQALRFSIDVYGSGALELVPCYLMLGEASIGLGRFKQAEEYLAYAKWAVLKHPQCSSTLKSKLHRNFGKLYAAQGRYKDAIRQLAHDIYCCSLELGPEHINTSSGYYNMGVVFLEMKELDNAMAMFDKVVEIWHTALLDVIRYGSDGATEEKEFIDEAQQVEGLQMLMKVLGIREHHLGSVHTATAGSYYTLGLLYTYLRDFRNAKERLSKALTTFEQSLGHDHDTTNEVRQLLQYIERLAT